MQTFDNPVDDSLRQALDALLAEQEDSKYLECFCVLIEPWVKCYAERSLNARAKRFPVLDRTGRQLHIENVTQETWIVILTKIFLFEVPEEGPLGDALERWISVIAKYVSWQYARTLANRNNPLVSLIVDYDEHGSGTLHEHISDEEQASPEDLAQASDEMWQLLEAIRKLRPDEQTLIMLRYMHQNSFDEIAKIMGRTNGALRVMHTRVIKKLRKLIFGGA